MVQKIFLVLTSTVLFASNMHAAKNLYLSKESDRMLEMRLNAKDKKTKRFDISLKTKTTQCSVSYSDHTPLLGNFNPIGAVITGVPTLVNAAVTAGVPEKSALGKAIFKDPRSPKSRMQRDWIQQQEAIEDDRIHLLRLEQPSDNHIVLGGFDYNAYKKVGTYSTKTYLTHYISLSAGCSTTESSPSSIIRLLSPYFQNFELYK